MSVSATQESVKTKKFDMFELQPGKTVDIEINHPVKLRIKVPLIGYEMGKYIILKYPATNQGGIMLCLIFDQIKFPL
jgi:hypothetical protein